MKISLVARLLMCLLAAAPLAACAGEEEEVSEGDDEVPAEARADGLSSASLAGADILRITHPLASAPATWPQPASEGWFDEKGKCGQTATANLLRHYGTEIAPQTLYEQGVYSLIGTRGTVIRNYLQSTHPDLGCRIEHPTDGPDFLKMQLAAKRPVMVLYKTDWKNSHWVTAVATTKSKGIFNGDEAVIVQSDGSYYAYRMSGFDAAWRNVYGLRRPSIVCNKASTKITPAWSFR